MFLYEKNIILMIIQMVALCA